MNETFLDPLFPSVCNSCVDTNTYSEAEIDKAIEMIKASKAAENDVGKQTDGWGSGKLEDEDEEAGW